MKLHFDVKFLLRQKTKVRLASLRSALVSIFTAPLSPGRQRRPNLDYKGLVALAFFDGVEGCIAITVGVRATSGTESDGPGKPGNGSEVEVFLEQFDIC